MVCFGEQQKATELWEDCSPPGELRLLPKVFNPQMQFDALERSNGGVIKFFLFFKYIRHDFHHFTISKWSV